MLSVFLPEVDASSVVLFEEEPLDEFFLVIFVDYFSDYISPRLFRIFG